MAPKLHKIISNPEQFATMVWNFLDDCKAKDIAPYKQRFALDHRIGKNALSDWYEKYKEPTEHDPHCLIAGAIKELERANELRCLDKLDKTSSNPNAMFLLKSCHGYIETDKLKVEHSGALNISVVSNIPGALGSSS